MPNPKVTTPEFRLSFPHLFEPHAFKEGQEKKYLMTMLYPKSTDLKILKELAKEAVLYKWPDPKKRPATLASPFVDGNTKEYDGYADHIAVSAKSKTMPGMVNQRREHITDESELYAGCYCRATIVAYAYSFGNQHGVSFWMHNIQKLRDGEPFSGKDKAENDFDAVDTGEEITDFAPAGTEAAPAAVEEVPSFF